MTDTGTESCCQINGMLELKKEWRTGDGESDWGMIFEGNKKMFWKEVKRVRKGEQARDEMVKDVNGQQ